MREREMHRVLAGAAADLQHVLAAGERLLRGPRGSVPCCARWHRECGSMLRFCPSGERASVHASASRPSAATPAAHWMPCRPGGGIGSRAQSAPSAGADGEAREVREDVGVLAAGAGEGEQRESREQRRGIPHPRRPVAQVTAPPVGRDQPERREHRGRGAEQVVLRRMQQRVDAVGEPARRRGSGARRRRARTGARPDSRRARRTRGSTAGAACPRAA